MSVRTRGMPAGWEVERSLLGGLLLDPASLPTIRETLRAEHFHRPTHAALYRLLCRLADGGTPADVTVVLDAAHAAGELERYGGAVYLLALPMACPSVDNLPAYATRIRNHAIRRQLIFRASAIVERAGDGDERRDAVARRGRDRWREGDDGNAKALTY